MKKTFLIIITLLILGMCISANAQESIKVYNRNEEVVISHNVFSYNEQHYLHIDDLQKLGLDVIKEDGDYTITSNDCFGVESQLVTKPVTINGGGNITGITPLRSFNTDDVKISSVICDSTYKCRATKLIGASDSIIWVPSDNDMPIDTMIRLNNELYISAQFVGEKLSHKYSLKNGRMDFYVADESAVIMDATVNLVKGAVASAGGYDVKIHTAYKTGEGNTIDDFELLSTVNCTIPENENNKSCMIETPAEKINDENMYFIVDFGDRYEFVCNEYDFSKVGEILVYGKQKDVTYTVNVNLPEADERDVPFTIYAQVDRKTYSKQGVVISGEKSTTVELTGLPVDTSYSTWIEFDYHKYKNAKLKDFNFINVGYVKDIKSDFDAQHSRKVVCTVSLPKGFVADNDIEIKVELSKYVYNGSIVIVDKLTDWDDSKTITLNNERRSEQVCLYSQADESMLSYKIMGNIDGLCQNGYLSSAGKTTSDKDLSKEIKTDLVTDITLLKCKNMTVSVYRPFGLSTDNDIFALVLIDDISTSSLNDAKLDFTKNPLIPAGEEKSQFELVVEEDKVYTFRISQITGDDRLFHYYNYAKYFTSPAQQSTNGYISFSDNSESLTLLQCVNVSGTVECEDKVLGSTAIASCKLYNGETVELTSEVNNGAFNLKIPEDTDTYTLGVQTLVGKTSYYISDDVSTNDENEATKIFFKYEDDKEVMIKYILQNPALPLEITTMPKYGIFTFKNVSDNLLEEFDVYVAYYGRNGDLISVKKTKKNLLPSGVSFQIQSSTSNYKIIKVKAFAWDRNSTAPLGNVAELNVNVPYTPDKDISVFKVGDINAVINGGKVTLSQAPEEINDTLYINAADLEKLGYKVTVKNTAVYIEKNETEFRFLPEEYVAVRTDYMMNFEISAPIIRYNEILIPVCVISDLFEEKAKWDNTEKTVILNMPFSDIEYSDIHCKAILDKYYKGVFDGYEDGSFRQSETILRSEAAAMFSRNMGYEFWDYKFQCSDVPSDHWAKSFIGICINEGVFGLEDNKFRPNDCITVEEAVIATLKMKGINYDNYIEAATESGLFTYIDTGNLERNITRSEFAQLLYNAG